MTIKEFAVKIEYTEHTHAISETVIYAHSKEDADYIARVQFLKKRRDEPTIDFVNIVEKKDLK